MIKISTLEIENLFMILEGAQRQNVFVKTIYKCLNALFCLLNTLTVNLKVLIT